MTRWVTGPGTWPAAQLHPVEAPHRADAEAGRGEEGLVGVVRVEEVDVPLVDGVAQLARELDGRLPADSGQDELLARRVDRAVADEEDVAADSLGEVAVDVEEDRPGLGVAGLGLEVAHDHVEVVVRLGPGAEAVRRRAPHGRHDDPDAVAVERGPLAERERQALDDHGRPRLPEGRAVRGIEPPGHALGHPVVVVRLEEREVLVEDLLGDPLELLEPDARIDAEVAERAIEAVEVLLQAEDAVPEGPRRVEHRVAVLEAAIPERDPHVPLEDDPAVEVRDSLACCLCHRRASCRWGAVG